MRAVNEMNLNQMDDSTPRALLSQKSGPKLQGLKPSVGLKGPLICNGSRLPVWQKQLKWLYLQYMHGMLGPNAVIQIRPSQCLQFGLKESSRLRQLERLEARGLVKLDRGAGRCARVTIVGCHTGWFGAV